MIKYDTQTFDIVFVKTVGTDDYQAQSVLAISNNEVIYSFKANDSSTHHLVKASLNPVTGSLDYSLDEEQYKNITGDSTYGSISRLSHDSETFWHVVNLGSTITYFQLNVTDFSIIGSGYNISSPINNGGLGMEVSQEVV